MKAEFSIWLVSENVESISSETSHMMEKDRGVGKNVPREGAGQPNYSVVFLSGTFRS